MSLIMWRHLKFSVFLELSGKLCEAVPKCCSGPKPGRCAFWGHHGQGPRPPRGAVGVAVLRPAASSHSSSVAGKRRSSGTKAEKKLP